MRQPRTSVRGNATKRFRVAERRQVIAFAEPIKHSKPSVCRRSAAFIGCCEHDLGLKPEAVTCHRSAVVNF